MPPSPAESPSSISLFSLTDLNFVDSQFLFDHERIEYPYLVLSGKWKEEKPVVRLEEFHSRQYYFFYDLEHVDSMKRQVDGLSSRRMVFYVKGVYALWSYALMLERRLRLILNHGVQRSHEFDEQGLAELEESLKRIQVPDSNDASLIDRLPSEQIRFDSSLLAKVRGHLDELEAVANNFSAIKMPSRKPPNPLRADKIMKKINEQVRNNTYSSLNSSHNSSQSTEAENSPEKDELVQLFREAQQGISSLAKNLKRLLDVDRRWMRVTMQQANTDVLCVLSAFKLPETYRKLQREMSRRREFGYNIQHQISRTKSLFEELVREENRTRETFVQALLRTHTPETLELLEDIFPNMKNEAPPVNIQCQFSEEITVPDEFLSYEHEIETEDDDVSDSEADEYYRSKCEDLKRQLNDVRLDYQQVLHSLNSSTQSIEEKFKTENDQLRSDLRETESKLHTLTSTYLEQEEATLDLEKSQLEQSQALRDNYENNLQDYKKEINALKQQILKQKQSEEVLIKQNVKLQQQIAHFERQQTQHGSNSTEEQLQKKCQALEEELNKLKQVTITGSTTSYTSAEEQLQKKCKALEEENQTLNHRLNTQMENNAKLRKSSEQLRELLNKR